MNGVKSFAISFAISLVIFGLIAFIIVQFVWPNDSEVGNSRPETVPSQSAIMPTE